MNVQWLGRLSSRKRSNLLLREKAHVERFLVSPLAGVLPLWENGLPMIDQHDNQRMYCRMLGHEVPFAYCRQGALGQPCRRIFDCWFGEFDIQQFMQDHFTAEQIQALLAPPTDKMVSLVELIRKAQENADGTEEEG